MGNETFIEGLIVVSGLLAFVIAFFLAKKIGKQSPGDERMQKISAAVKLGAKTYLKTQYKVLGVFVAIVFLLIWIFLDDHDLMQGRALCFLLGALSSTLAGWFGMDVSTTSAVRTAEAARTNIKSALTTALGSGVVMGLMVVGFGVLGTFICIKFLGATSKDESGIAVKYWGDISNRIFTFGLGASSIALFARVGGGIFTKAADVGGDLVGKIEAGIPEDDPRNPAVIADSVGDNVGDVAGMGADLFESYVGAIIACMALAAAPNIRFGDGLAFDGAQFLLPLGIAALGIIASVIGAFMAFSLASDKIEGIAFSLHLGNWIASGILVLGSWWLVTTLGVTVDMGPDTSSLGVFWSIVAGLGAGILIGSLTQHYTSEKGGHAIAVAEQAQTGSATNIIQGLAVGMKSTGAIILVIAVSIMLSYKYGGLYGLSIAAVGMLGTLGMSLGVDAFGPVADNAGGIAEMAHLPPQTRVRTDALDAAGNTTAAIGKGFAIGSAALTALALFQAYAVSANTSVLDLLESNVTMGLLLGAMLPFVFSAMAMEAVGRAAGKMVHEVRRQFKEIPGLLQGEAEPEYDKCIEISTHAALWEMILPGLLAILVPVAVGFGLGKSALGGLLAGALASSVMLAIMMSNAGGVWDNAKKWIEAGNLGGKGSPVHKAAVVGDTVGDPFKDTAGPSLNILIKLMCIVSLVLAPSLTK